MKKKINKHHSQAIRVATDEQDLNFVMLSVEKINGLVLLELDRKE